MLRDLLSSRWFQGSLAFFVLCVGGSLLYHWHVVRTTERDMARNDRFLLGLQKQKETRPAADTGETSTGGVEETETLPETDAAQMGDDTDVSPIDEAAEFDDLADAFLPEDVVSEEEQVSEEVPVSPYGFGPYPEVPADYPSHWACPSWLWSEERVAQSKAAQDGVLERRGISFTAFMKINELLGRLSIRLWNEGRDFNGITTLDSTGLFYPDEPNVLYVSWSEAKHPNGEVRRYISTSIGSALQNMPIAAMEGREPPPDWMDIRSLSEGIDPYEYLGLNR